MTSTLNRPSIGRTRLQNIAGPWWKDACAGNSNRLVQLFRSAPKGVK